MKKIVLALTLAIAGVTPVIAQTVDPLQSETLIKKAINEPGTAWTFYGAGGQATAWGAALLATGLPVYFLMRRGSTSQLEAAIPSAPPESSA